MSLGSKNEWNVWPRSFCFVQAIPSGQSPLQLTLSSTKPLRLSLIHHSFKPKRRTSVAHNLQILLRGASGLGSTPAATPCTSTNNSDSKRALNPFGCDWICTTICGARRNKRSQIIAGPMQGWWIHLSVYMSWSPTNYRFMSFRAS